MKYKSILITGGCGFIGTSLIVELIKKYPDTRLRILDNLSVGSVQDLSEVCDFKCARLDELPTTSPIELVIGDICDVSTVNTCIQGVDCVIHFAANTGVGPSVDNPRFDMYCNVFGTFNLLEASRLHGVKKFIFASSGAPAGEVEPPIHEELPPHPVSPYGASKLAGEGYCSAYYRSFNLDTICLRFGNVYGPRSKNKSSVVAKFIKMVLHGESCVIFGDGTQTRDFLYIADLVRAVILSIECEVGGETFQIATGNEMTVTDIANLIASELAKRGISMDIHHDNPRIGDVRRNYADTTKAKRILNWSTQVDVHHGISLTIEWFIKKYAL
jgi:UDP-glucose 4-epimerase